jgi:hypothetical protein
MGFSVSTPGLADYRTEEGADTVVTDPCRITPTAISQPKTTTSDPSARHLVARHTLAPQQRIADGHLATHHHLGVDAHIDVAEGAPEATTMSRWRFAVTGLTSVSAHLVIGEITRSCAAPRMISEPIQSCSLQADAPSK